MDQTVEVGNDSGCDYVGWVRARLTQAPPFGAAWSHDHLVLASVGFEDDGEWPVDLRVRLPAASRRVVDLATLVPCVRCRSWGERRHPPVYEAGNLNCKAGDLSATNFQIAYAPVLHVVKDRLAFQV